MSTTGTGTLIRQKKQFASKKSAPFDTVALLRHSNATCRRLFPIALSGTNPASPRFFPSDVCFYC
jgi:hypothetical protein